MEERRQRAFIEPRETWRESELKEYDGTGLRRADFVRARTAKSSTSGGAGTSTRRAVPTPMAGRDATRQLAKNRLDGDPDYEPDDGAPLNPAERASLALWVASFEGKYDVVGKLVDGD